MPNEMSASDVLWFIDLFEEPGIMVWLDGGWGVDALLGEQTRLHGDVDIMIPVADANKLVSALRSSGFSDVHTDDHSPRNFVIGGETGRLIDFHIFHVQPDGSGIYGPGEIDWIMTVAELGATGTTGGREVRALSAEYQVRSHTGYALKATDFADIGALHRRFGLALPEEYRGKV